MSEERPATDRANRQRLIDLLRYCRATLHEERLISDGEYAELASDHPAVERLETYDQQRKRIEALERELAEARRQRDTHLETIKASALREYEITSAYEDWREKANASQALCRELARALHHKTAGCGCNPPRPHNCARCLLTAHPELLND